MERVSVFLRTPLFSFGGDEAPLPAGVMVLEGQLAAQEPGALRIEADRLSDQRGRELSDEAVSLWIPWEKIDHVLIWG